MLLWSAKPKPRKPPMSDDPVDNASPATESSTHGSAWEILAAFLKLGLTSFGGPVAHLGYFRTEFVERRKWLDDKSYSDLVALGQFLPDPASSQVGIAVGLGRAGWLGALAAWVGFTLPSAMALILFAFGVTQWAGVASSGAVHGLKVVAVAVVAQAVWGMAKSLCPDRLRAGVAVAAALLVLAVPGAMGQIAAIVSGGLVGRWVLQLGHLPPARHREYGVSRRVGAALLVLCGALLLLLPALAACGGSVTLSAISAFYQAGALVFGGGHVVLPLLQAGVVPTGWVANDAFLAGYGAAQTVPGPLFTFAAYLGAVMPAPLGGWVGGLVLLLAIFVPAFLLVVGALPFWEALRLRDGVQRAMGGINAASAFGLLVYGKVSPVAVVAFAALCGWAMAG
jgi:chromate transporter